MELDVYVPEIELAAEYQGEHHFRNIYCYGDIQVQGKRDSDKRLACKKVDETWNLILRQELH